MEEHMLILIFPAVLMFFLCADLRNNYRWARHSRACPCPYGPDACDRGKRS